MLNLYYQLRVAENIDNAKLILITDMNISKENI